MTSYYRALQREIILAKLKDKPLKLKIEFSEFIAQLQLLNLNAHTKSQSPKMDTRIQSTVKD
jgi:hypothetical protein